MTEIDPLIAKAVSVLRAGGLVAFPTETVYGLGADATSAEAVAKIFAAKGRPSTNPLIVHVADAATARRYAPEWPPAASRLAERLWPGPLTLVLPKSPEIVPAVSAGLTTVGLRVPAHPLALQLLRQFAGPVAAPSANRSNRISPTTARHVRDELGDAVEIILDGGPCAVGIESTVLDLTTPRPTILRPGGVSREQIEAVIGTVDVAGAAEGDSGAARSPGRHPVHYAPRAPAFRFESARRPEVHAELGAVRGRPVVALFLGRTDSVVVEMDDDRTAPGGRWFMPAEPEDYARWLYQALRMADGMGVEQIWVEMPPDRPDWAAVRDRLVRATRPLSPSPLAGEGRGER
jgi:L-threonylcarbamoyladenylate synthase